MANTKVTSHVIANDAITADQLATAAVTHAKLHATMDLSGKTVTLPAVAIPSASTATTQSASDSTTKVATTAYVTTAISNLVDSAPAELSLFYDILNVIETSQIILWKKEKYHIQGTLNFLTCAYCSTSRQEN